MRMVEVKTAELIGPALDWAVAKATGEPIELVPANPEWGTVAELMAKEWLDRIGEELTWSPSTDWAQGGPLLEKYLSIHGETPLTALCRAIVAAHSGDVVSVPAELVNGGDV